MLNVKLDSDSLVGELLECASPLLAKDHRRGQLYTILCPCKPGCPARRASLLPQQALSPSHTDRRLVERSATEMQWKPDRFSSESVR